MAFAKLEDLSGAVELVVFPDTYAKVSDFLKEERPVLIGGLLESEEGALKVIVDSIILLEDVLKKTKRVSVHLDQVQEESYGMLVSLLSEFPGSTQLDFVLSLKELGTEVHIESSVKSVQISNELLESIHAHFGGTQFVKVHMSEGSAQI